MKALDKKLLRDILHWRGQIIAIALVVACGIASFVSMLSAYESLQLSQTTYYDNYRFAQVFVQLKRAPESLARKIGDIPGVMQVNTRVVVDVTLDVPKLSEPATGRLVSIPERQTPILNDLYIRQGRYIEPGKSDEVLISEAFAKANNLKLGDNVEAVINGRWQKLQIVGIALSPEYVYAIRGAGDLLPDDKLFGVLWMGRKALGTAFNMDGAFNDVALTLMPRTNEKEVIFRLDRLLEKYGGLGAYDREDQISNRFLSEEIEQLQGSAIFVPTIFLGIAAFLLHMLLSRLVSTQRDQIAVLKAFGYNNISIGLHYLKFVLIIVFFGAFLGTALGLWFGIAVTQNYTRFFNFPLLRYEASLGLILGSIFISGGSGVFGAFVAVKQAVSLPPAEAMRPEPPAQFRATLLERLGLQQLVSPAVRIILRNIERKPFQALFSALGIALAVAILVVGRYFSDVMVHIIDVQFRNVQREDVTIVFNEPRPARARYEVEHLPGVIYAEPFRTVAVRLRFEHRSYRSALTGINPQAELRRLINRDLNSVNLPGNGVVLTTQLANTLGVDLGESLTVEVLEGARPIRTVQVVGKVDELLGMSAYMDIGALNQLMREGGTISGAYLMVDDNILNRLYGLLKRTPAVAGVSIRKTAIERFEETIAGSLSIFTTVLVIFASIIAFGVVYNAARIALSERSRELATLRIIGFTQAEIAFILLGEQAIITLIAIPLGFMMGFGLCALMSSAYQSELYRLPLVVTNTSYGFALIVIVITAILSGFIVRRQLKDLDLIAVLKTKE
ncbi:ABC transporter permease [Mastigocoleus testarum]|uniref:ABC transporter permease n=1 Tax=Mastigocoleus testarum BC008 TaxID=371196 RepID=A0A0V7ZGE6_9CYAN|nr:ABC transporter permease [Mastigocoleus testarum]KST63668.1 ABC transporter permease [Mastigocoleus testarum BC008]KST63790.1 ABC transporter permease [Mastigocoleus testarum BC008]